MTNTQHTLGPSDLATLFDALEVLAEACSETIRAEVGENNPDQEWIEKHSAKRAHCKRLQEALYDDATVSGRASWTLS